MKLCAPAISLMQTHALHISGSSICSPQHSVNSKLCSSSLCTFRQFLRHNIPLTCISSLKNRVPKYDKFIKVVVLCIIRSCALVGDLSTVQRKLFPPLLGFSRWLVTSYYAHNPKPHTALKP